RSSSRQTRNARSVGRRVRCKYALNAARLAGGATHGRSAARLARIRVRNAMTRRRGAEKYAAADFERARRPRGHADYFLRRTTTMMIGCREVSRIWWGLKPKNHWTNSKPPASSTTVFNS